MDADAAKAEVVACMEQPFDAALPSLGGWPEASPPVRACIADLERAYAENGAAFRAAVAKLPADLLDSGVLGFQAGCTGAQLNSGGRAA